LFKHFGCEERPFPKHFGCKADILFTITDAKEEFCSNILGAEQATKPTVASLVSEEP